MLHDKKEQAVKTITYILLLLVLLGGCEKSPNMESKTEGVLTIKEIKVSERPLSKINTDESDWFAKNYNNGEPFFDDNGGSYYYYPSNHIPADSLQLYLHYDKGDGNPVRIELPEYDHFTVGIFYNNTLYGISHDDNFPNNKKCNFVTKYQDGIIAKVFNTSIDHWYFSSEGIYYQIGKLIYLMDYDGNNSRLIVEIPEELYLDSWSSQFVVYRGSIWYCNGSYLDDNDIPLWSYNIENQAFLKFNEGGLDAINNGYLYFAKYKSSGGTTLWRFNIETFCIEKVSDLLFQAVSFFDQNILFETDNEVYKINSSGTAKILDNIKIDNDLYFAGISTQKDRIFVRGFMGAFNGKIVEIDLTGNIIKQICEY